MTFASILSQAQSSPIDEDVLDQLAHAALREDEERAALELISSAARQTGSAFLWHWTGTLQRALGDHLDAFASFSEALRLDPASQSAAYALARTALEAGWDSVQHFERALALGQPTSEILLGRAAARFARGEGDTAIGEIEAILEQVPMWLDGHRQFAQLRALTGQPERASDSLEAALSTHPDSEALWITLLDQNIAKADFAALDANVSRARAAGIGGSLDAFEAIAAGETGDSERADRLFALPGAPPIWHIRHLLRTGRASAALPILDDALAGPDPNSAWPYAAVVWRKVKDPRYDWLVGTDGYVRTYDLTPDLPPIDRLADVLRGLHRASGPFLDQSVRGGTQTDGPLFSRTEPEIRALSSAVVGAVERYKAELGPFDPDHPLLGVARDREVRFAGSWSVSLTASGFHERHVHTKGWISSALYLVLPAQGDRGVLELGAPPSTLGLAQPPIRKIEPAVGQLVLFPSWLWHGTRPFAEGERLTVAFDVKAGR